MELKERLKSPVFWTGFVLLIADALKLFGVYEVSSETISGIQDAITFIFQVFTALNNPKDRKHF